MRRVPGMFCLLAARYRTFPPVMTLALVASCLVTTIPQAMLPESYSALAGSTGLPGLPFFTLPTFSHEPAILVLHLALNSLVFLFFGAIIESMLGTARFSILTLTTLAVSTALVFARGAPSHGASGVCWGYQLVVLLFVFVYAETRPRLACRDPFVRFSIAFMAFNLVITPLIEAFFFGVRLGDNFGQFVHLASIVTVAPIILLWRKEIERSVHALLGLSPYAPLKQGRAPVCILGIILFYNALSTVVAIIFTLEGARH